MAAPGGSASDASERGGPGRYVTGIIRLGRPARHHAAKWFYSAAARPGAGAELIEVEVLVRDVLPFGLVVAGRELGDRVAAGMQRHAHEGRVAGHVTSGRGRWPTVDTNRCGLDGHDSPGPERVSTPLGSG